MAIHTSSIFYHRGIPKTYKNFAFIAQTNNIIPTPIGVYLKNYNFINRNITNNVKGYQLFPWSK
jgi:hypothetical protein